MERLEKFYQQMVLIRLFEERLLKLFSEGLLNGTTHTYIGQEANAVAIIDHLTSEDIIFSNHRCHGHYLARFDDPKGLFAEIMGKKSGICAGRGGSQHLCSKNFYTNGIQGGHCPIVVGMAYAEKRLNTGQIVVSFIGDGTLGEGAYYESLNMASLWSVPLLIVIENNRYAQTTPLELNLAGSMVDRARAFGISAGEIDSTDVEELSDHFEKIITQVREVKRPHVEVIHTYRLSAHSKGDDFRDKLEIEKHKQKEPLVIAAKRLSPEYCQRVHLETSQRIDQILEEVRSEQ